MKNDTTTTEAAVLRFNLKPTSDGISRALMPIGAKILNVEAGKSGISVWAMASADEQPETEARYFLLIKSGKVISHGTLLTHLKTFMTEAGALHLFEVPADLISVMTFVS